jgi:hypothetical protein
LTAPGAGHERQIVVQDCHGASVAPIGALLCIAQKSENAYESVKLRGLGEARGLSRQCPRNPTQSTVAGVSLGFVCGLVPPRRSACPPN